MENWKDIAGYEGIYQVSDLGRVRSVPRMGGNNHFYDGVIRKQGTNIWGYKHVVLCKNSIEKTRTVHRLVAQAFIPNPENLPCINHKDEDKTNNMVGNLEWCSYEYNSNYGTGSARRSAKKSRPVIGTDRDGNEYRFASSYEATEAITGKRERSHITDCCNGKRASCYGMTWRYE